VIIWRTLESRLRWQPSLRRSVKNQYTVARGCDLCTQLVDTGLTASFSALCFQFATNAPSTAADTTEHSPLSAQQPYAHVSKKSKIAAAVDSYPKSIIQHILDTCNSVDQALALHRSKLEAQAAQAAASSSAGAAAAVSPSAAAAATPSASSAATASSGDSSGVDYVALLSSFRFGEVDK
jgi:hypothetical protein